MKKLNALLSKLDNEFPRVTKNFKYKGLGKLVQVIMSSTEDPFMKEKIKDKSKIGININDQEEFKIIEVLYEDKKQKKEYEKELYEVLKETISGRIVYIHFISQEKESLLMQFLIMQDIEPIEI